MSQQANYLCISRKQRSDSAGFAIGSLDDTTAFRVDPVPKTITAVKLSQPAWLDVRVREASWSFGGRYRSSRTPDSHPRIAGSQRRSKSTSP